MHCKSLLVAAIAGMAVAQRPASESICDYYTKALLKDNTAANQATILTLLVNTVVVGNYTKPKIPGVTFPNVMVPGILAKGMENGEMVNLLPYFDGSLASTNQGGSHGVSVNFLDGGGAAPLLKNMPANDKTSNQYFLLTHLYQFFGTLLGCSQQGMGAFPSYQGQASMYEVHKFMDLDAAQFKYFVTQVGLAAASFGVAKSDITTVAGALMKYFGYRCAPPVALVQGSPAVLESICTASDCPKSSNGTCPKPVPMPKAPNATMTGPSGPAKTTPSSSAAVVPVSFTLLALGLMALFL